jgi:hypothetical protein
VGLDPDRHNIVIYHGLKTTKFIVKLVCSPSTKHTSGQIYLDKYLDICMYVVKIYEKSSFYGSPGYSEHACLSEHALVALERQRPEHPFRIKLKA